MITSTEGQPHLSKKGAITKPLCNPESRKPWQLGFEGGLGFRGLGV